MPKKPIIQHYRRERIPNPYPPGDLPWQIYHIVRNDILRVCRQFGTVGPMAECPLTGGLETPDDWPAEPGDRSDYYIVDDQYNHERYLYMYVHGERFFTVKWLGAVMKALARHTGWGIGILSFSDGYMLVYADRLLVTGKGFRGCRDFASVMRSGKQQSKRFMELHPESG